jgi:HAMP domain-containing protein
MTGWKFVLNISEDEILGPVRELTLHSTLIGVAGLLVLVVIVSIIARRLAHPVLELTRTASAIEQGNFRTEMLNELPHGAMRSASWRGAFRKWRVKSGRANTASRS